jgi:1,4-dihydroxy-6-naphthoate synthase
MFYAMTHDKIDTGPYEFVHQLEDIETLNRRALAGELEVSAVSIHAYAYLSDKYALLPNGASMGDRYGPMLVAKRAIKEAEVPNLKLAIPGTLTSAFLALQLWAGKDLKYEVVPFDRIVDEVLADRFDAGLIIHEGQLTYAQNGLELVQDLGVWWHERTGLPLPLGGNIVRKDLGAQTMKDVARLVLESIQYGLDHRDEAIDYAMQYGRGIDRNLADRFIGMYVNNWTRDYGPAGRRAVVEFLQTGADAGLLSTAPAVEFVEL